MMARKRVVNPKRPDVSASLIRYRIEHPYTDDDKRQRSETAKRKGISPPIQYLHWTDLSKCRAIETRAGGFWYGNVIYKDDINRENKYCELWTEDLRERIRAYWGYVSALSGKPETSITKTGKVRTISCHHVYYQKKACCIWDEDDNGYYANINIGTLHNPKLIRYDIDGDPNKFVTLTSKEHKQTDYDKLKWIKTFEQIIEDNGGKCYFTKEDIENLLK